MSGITSTPKPPIAQAIAVWSPRSRRVGKAVAVDLAVVVTVSRNGVGVELILTELGTVQLAAGGDPEQLSDTLPVNPGPPTIRL